MPAPLSERRRQEVGSWRSQLTTLHIAQLRHGQEGSPLQGRTGWSLFVGLGP